MMSTITGVIGVLQQAELRG